MDARNTCKEQHLHEIIYSMKDEEPY